MSQKCPKFYNIFCFNDLKLLYTRMVLASFILMKNILCEFHNTHSQIQMAILYSNLNTKIMQLIRI